MLAQQLRRLKQCRRADDIVVATTTNAEDDPIVGLARVEGVGWFRGSESDVLGRYAGAALDAKADVVVRVTADCPLIDPGLTDLVIEELTSQANQCDYAANIVTRSYPRGLDVEALFCDTLQRVARMASSSSAREHVTHFILRERPELFVTRSVADVEDNSDLRWTVDTGEDLALIRQIYSDLRLGEQSRAFRQVLAHVRSHPHLMVINGHIQQKVADT